MTNTTNVAGQTLSVTCSLRNIAGSFPSPKLMTYRPGTYFEDGLDELYNIGGTNLSNTMDIGLITPGNGQSAAFDFSCSATLGGAPFALGGIVFADAETTSINEFSVLTLPAGATMRVIERARPAGCDAGYVIARNGSNYLYEVAPPYNCAPERAPVAVNFLDGVSTARIGLKGQGKQAIAVGVMVDAADYGDAPSSYGAAAHIPQTSWSGGEVVQGSTDIFSGSFTTATLVPSPNALLGTAIDIENAPFAGATATLDNTNGLDDEDGLDVAALAPLYRTMAGRSYNISIACSGNASVRGWIDFDRNGVFDSDERSASVNCNGTSAALNWVVPADIQPGQSYLRVRTAVEASEIADPVGVADSGEVEDYALEISDPRIRVAKITLGSAGGAFDFSASNTTVQPASLTTATAGVAITGAPLSIIDIGAAVQITETNLPVGWGMTGLNCINAGGGAISGIVYDGATRSATIPAGALTVNADVTCTFTNANLPTLALSKTWRGAAANDTATLIATGGSLNPLLVSTAATADETDTGIPVKVEVGDVFVLSEELGASNSGSYTGSAWSCSGGTLTGGNTLTIGAADAALAIVCTITNTRQQTDLAVVKTVTPDPVLSGQVVSYTIVATNNGPNPGNGALLQDIVGSGLDCTTPLPVADCVGSGGAACPSPTVPISVLLGSGITIGAFPVGGQITVMLQCTVTATGRP
ncbi:MAG: DUF11 domain-containing protein [Sphingopyxis sp.]|nr:DUF11 domain-containing protein [Sphingopyxis sp.]